MCKITHFRICANYTFFFVKLHILYNIKAVSFTYTLENFTLDQFFYTTSGCDGCDKYEVCHAPILVGPQTFWLVTKATVQCYENHSGCMEPLKLHFTFWQTEICYTFLGKLPLKIGRFREIFYFPGKNVICYEAKSVVTQSTLKIRKSHKRWQFVQCN